MFRSAVSFNGQIFKSQIHSFPCVRSDPDPVILDRIRIPDREGKGGEGGDGEDLINNAAASIPNAKVVHIRSDF